MKIKVKKLDERAVMPTKAHPSDAGFDLTSIAITEHNELFVEHDTGLAFEIPNNHVGLVFPRSSISKTNMLLSNAVGVVDPEYRGSVKFRFRVRGVGQGDYKPGDRIGQLVIIPLPEIQLEEVKELSTTGRGTGGYGSTGK